MKKLLHPFYMLLYLIAIPAAAQEYPESWVEPVTYVPPQYTFQTTTLGGTTAAIISDNVDPYQAWSVDLNSLVAHLDTTLHQAQVNFKIDGKDYILNLMRHDLRSSDYVGRVTDDVDDFTEFKRAEEIEDFKDIITYKGFANGDLGNIVRMTITNDFIYGYIYDKADSTWLMIHSVNDFLLKSNSSPSVENEGKVLVYQFYDLAPIEAICEAERLGPDDNPPYINPDCDPKIFKLELALEADYEYFSIHGNNSVQQMLTHVNLIEGLYNLNFNLGFVVTHTNIYTNTNQPYTSTNPVQLVGQVKTNWNLNNTGIVREIAVLFTGKVIPNWLGRVAEIGGFKCNDLSNSYAAVKDSRLLYKTLAHEIGHLLGAEHISNCGGSIRSSIMCTGEDQSLSFDQTNYPKILNHLAANSSCLGPLVNQDINQTWIRTYTNDQNYNKLGTWNLDVPREYYRVIGDFDGSGTDELLLMSVGTSNNWVNMLTWNCGNPGDWVHKWSNFGNNTIYTWNMYTNDRHIAGDFDGDGKDDLLSISGSQKWATAHKFTGSGWDYLWSNMGNYYIGAFGLQASARYIVGDFTGNGKDEILCLNETGWAILVQFDGTNFQTLWNNNGTGGIAGIPVHGLATTSSRYLRGRLTITSKDQLLTLISNQANILQYNPLTTSWSSVWNQTGGTHIAGWSFPVPANDIVVIGNLDSDAREEIAFFNQSWAQTADYNGTTLVQNWTNGGSGFIEDYHWYLSGTTKMYMVKSNPNYPKQLLGFRQFVVTGGTFPLKWSENRYEVGMFRSNSNDNKRLVNPNNPGNQTSINSYEPVVYPNPAENLITIVAPNQQEILQVMVVDAIGKIVLRQQANTKEISVSLEGLPNGIYMVQMITGNKVFSKKIVKI